MPNKPIVSSPIKCFRLLFSVVSCLVLLGATLHVFVPGKSAAETARLAPKNTTPIQHIIIMVKENRTFDNYFGTFPGANGATTYTDPSGTVHPLNHEVDTLAGDISHSHTSSVLAYDNGKMDKFSEITGAMQKINGALTDVADSQFYQSDIPNYWQYAQTFTLADNFFSTVSGTSFGNHLFTIAGTDSDADESPQNLKNKDMHNRAGKWGCDSTKGTTVEERHADGSITEAFPCYDFTTLGDLLTAANISWKYYAPSYGQQGYQWSSYDAIRHIRTTPAWAQHVVNSDSFISDVQNNTLPQVSWLVQSAAVSDHPPSSVCLSENWTVKQINAIMQNSTLWPNTAIVLTWDEFGGFYDHVAPPQGPNSQIEYGFRVPALIISPYSKAAKNGSTVNHTFLSFPSIIRMVEDIFQLPSLGGLDATSNSLLKTLDFTRTPIQPLILQTRTCPAGPSASQLDNLSD